jgi:hypothetical protein
MFPHTVTLYNVTVEFDKAQFKEVTNTYITLLRGVLVDASKAVNVRTSGLEGADAVNLYIPFDVEAVDAETGEKRVYVGPQEYERLTDKTDFWTLSIDGTAGATFFIKGEVIMPDKSYETIEGMVDDVYNVTKVDEKDFGRLKHWEVGGN